MVFAVELALAKAGRSIGCQHLLIKPVIAENHPGDRIEKVQSN
jgi:hypothetical protein